MWIRTFACTLLAILPVRACFAEDSESLSQRMVAAGFDGDAVTLRSLLEMGANVDAKSKATGNNTALHGAARSRSAGALGVLAEQQRERECRQR